jgi:hypothetical protein
VFALALALAGVLAGCGGSRGDTTAPDADPQPPVQGPGTPGTPGTPAPSVAGNYVLEQINGSKPGTLVTIANPGGAVVGLYRFEATTLTLDAGKSFTLALRFTDDKSPLGVDDQGTLEPGGTTTQGAQSFTFRSATFGDAFVGIVLDDVAMIQYDLDGDGQAETAFAFRRAN